LFDTKARGEIEEKCHRWNQEVIALSVH